MSRGTTAGVARLTFAAALLSAVACASPPGLPSETAGPPPQSPDSGVRASSFDPQAITKLAVVFGVSRDLRVKESIQRLLEDEFIQSALQKGYNVATRSDVEAVLKELKLQASGVTDRNATALGKLLNVPAVLIVSITQWKTERDRGIRRRSEDVFFTAIAGISARLVSVEKAEIWWLGRRSGTGRTRDRDGTEILVSVARGVADGFPARKPSQ